jgi:hypothetical protein
MIPVWVGSKYTVNLSCALHVTLKSKIQDEHQYLVFLLFIIGQYSDIDS